MSLLALLMLVGCAAGDQSGYALVEPTASVSATVSVAPQATTVSATSTTTEATSAYETSVAHASAPVSIYVSPTVAIETRAVPAETILGTPTVMPVLEGPVDGWVKLSLPGRPNEASGWARAELFRFERVDQRIEVDLSTMTLTFFEEGAVVITTPVAIGSPTNPTPQGDFFVTDIVVLTDPSGPWGPYALGLSARSDTITEFNGGDGIIGIHGTNRPDRIGEPVSLGCVRVPNDIIANIAERVQLGVPVSIG
ncbi:MAG TPA: L,D-transpeptidase [Acidimicrobiia bacterium]|nr:L,D-transpeptidase [Acidimicrobiia bacterium]